MRINFEGGGSDFPSYYERFGGASLSAALNKYVYRLIEKRSDEKIHIISTEHHIVENWQDNARMDVRDNGLEIPLAALKDLGRDISANHFLASEIPQGT